MAVRPARSHRSRRTNRPICAPRLRRLFIEQFESRQMLSAAPSGTDTTVTAFEDRDYFITTPDFGFTDQSDSPADQFFAVQFTSLPTAGALKLNGLSVTAGQFILVTQMNAGELRFTPAANAYGLAYATLTFKVQDNAPTDNLDPSPKTLTIDLTPVNDPPAGADNTVTTPEDTSYTFSTADFGFTDPADIHLFNILQAVRITSLLLNGGTLTDNGTPIGPGAFVSVVNIIAGLLKYHPQSNQNGAPLAAFTFQVQDNGGTANGGSDLDPTSNTILINVNAVNDAPHGADSTITTPEDTPYIFSPSNFGYSDPNDIPSNQFLAVKITSLPTNGALTIGGALATPGMLVPAASLSAGSLKFLPFPSMSGSPYASFTFQVQDDGGTGGGGVNLDPTPNAISINVLSVNDPPTGKHESISYIFGGGGGVTFQLSSFALTDLGDFPQNSFAGVKITTVPAAGVLANSGVAVNAGDFIPAADIAAGRLHYQPTVVGSPFQIQDSFTFQVQDNGGVAFGGLNLDPAPKTMSLIGYSSLGDPPAGASDRVVTLFEDHTYTFALADFDFTTPQDGSSVTSVMIATVPQFGTLSNAGVQVAAGTTIALTSIQSGHLKFTPHLNRNGSPLTSFGATVQDPGSSRTFPYEFSFHVTPVNDAPNGTSTIIGFEENTVFAFTPSDFGFADFTDASPNNFYTVRITAPATAGLLTCGGVPVKAGDVVLVHDIAAGKLRFTPAANGTGPTSASFEFRVQDDGGTANFGPDTDLSVRTMTLNVFARNYPPQGADVTITILENSVLAFTPADFPFTDPQDSPPDTLASIRIQTLPASGTLTNNGNPVNVGQVVPLADLAANRLVFTPTPNTSGFPYAQFTFFVKDNGGTANGGIDLALSPNTLTFHVASFCDRGASPVDRGATVTAWEDQPYAFSSDNLGIYDPFGESLPDPQGVKIVTLPARGTLSNNGVAVAVGQIVTIGDIALGRLQFLASPNTYGTAYAQFGYQVQDQLFPACGDDGSGTITLNVTPVNDPPFGPNPTWTPLLTSFEDNVLAFAAANFSFSDPNDNGAHQLAAVIITSPPTSGMLRLGNTILEPGNIFFMGRIPVNQIGQLNFVPAPNFNGDSAFTFRLQDNGGTANGGSDTSPFNSTLTIRVTSVNDAPLGTNQTVTTAEDTTYTLRIADFGFADVNDSPQNALTAVKITTLPSAGTLTLDGLAVSAGVVIPVTSISDGQLKFTPAANANGAPYANFTFQVQDNGGITNGGQDLNPTPNTLTINVTSVNDPPSGTHGILRLYCDRPLSISDFGYSDSNDNPSNDPLAVKIVSLSPGTVLTNDGTPVVAGQLVSFSDLTAGKLRHSPGPFGPSWTIGFQVQDIGGIANGGADQDASTRSLIIHYPTDLGFAPEGIDSTISLLEDRIYAFQLTDFPFSDANLNNLRAVRVTTLPLSGVLQNNGAPVEQGQFISAFDIVMGRFTFAPTAHTSGLPLASFKFQIQDDGGGGCNAGFDLDPSPNTLTINVTPINDPPLGTDHTLSIQENVSRVLTLFDFGFHDPFDSPANSFLAVKITTLPQLGLLTNGITPVTAGQFVTFADIASGNVRYTPPPNIAGYTYAFASLSFQVQDDGGTANGGLDLDVVPNTLTFNIVPCYPILAPSVNRDQTLTTYEDQTYTFRYYDLVLEYLYDDPPDLVDAVKIVTLPTAGSLKLNGVPLAAGDFVSPFDILLGNLQFLPAPNAYGSAYAKFVFQLLDDSIIVNACTNDNGRGTITFNVVGVNDPPTGASKTINWFEDASYILSVTEFGFRDPNDTPPLGPGPPNAMLGVRITTIPANGRLLLSTNEVSAGDLISVSSLSGGQLRFAPAANQSGSPYTSFTFQVIDNGGPWQGGIDTDPVPKTITFNLTLVNDPPSGVDRTLPITTVPYQFVLPDFGFTDSLDTPANSLAAVVITTLPTAGNLTLNGVSVVPGLVVSATDIALGSLMYTPPFTDLPATTISFSFQVKDDGGTANGGLDIALNANIIAFNVFHCDFGTPSIVRDKTINTFEDQTYTFSSADFSLSDPLETPPPAEYLKIISLPPTGTLVNANVPLSPGQYVSISDITEGRLKFLPAANATGAASFVFQVETDDPPINHCIIDDGIGTITFNVIAVNDSPSGLDRFLAASPSTPYTFSVADFPIIDNNDSPPNTLAAVAITTLPATGTLSLNGVPIQHLSPAVIVPAQSLIAGALQFTPVEEYCGGPAGSFMFQVKDNGGTANGGADLDPVPKTISFFGHLGFPPNHAPAGLDGVITVLEDAAYVFKLPDFGFSDDHDVPRNNLQAVIVSSLPAAGTLFNNGVPLAAENQYILRADILAGHFTFKPAANVSGSPLTSFTFQVRDDGAPGCGSTDLALDPSPNTLTFNVWPVNDPPSFTPGADQNVTDESGPQSIAAWATAISDGPPDEAEHQVHFVVASNFVVVGSSNPDLFTISPAIDPTGRLTFTPAPNVSGTAEIAFFLADDGGTANGGIEESQSHTLTIHITKLRPWHNAAIALDVIDNGHVVAEDALAIINFLNAFGPQPVPANAGAEPPYYDVTGDSAVAPSDALAVINHLNAYPSGEGESNQKSEAKPVVRGSPDPALLDLLALDLATQPKRRPPR